MPRKVGRSRPTARPMGNIMQFIDCARGRYQIYAGTLASPDGKSGFGATLVIKIRSDDGINEVTVFRDLSLVDGMVWAEERDALHYAVRRAHYVIDARPAMLARLARRPHPVEAVDLRECTPEPLSGSSAV